MNNSFTKALSTPVPQREPENPRQVRNNAGGYTFTVDDETRLRRFLVLGTDGGTYYVSERDLTRQNVDFLDRLIEQDEDLVLYMIRDVSVSGAAATQSPALFALAKLLVQGKNKQAVIEIGPHVVRTFTHLAEFATYLELLGADSHNRRLQDPRYAAGMMALARQAQARAAALGKPYPTPPVGRPSGSRTGGWGRAKRDFVARWYTSKTPEALAYQGIKYRQRDGWTHRDLLRLSHPKGLDRRIVRFLLGQPLLGDEAPALIHGFQRAQAATSVAQVLEVLSDHPKLPWEAVPTQFLNEPALWKHLFYNGALTGQALVRQITRLARIGAFNDMVFARDYATKLADKEMIDRTRLHPINYLNAQVVHTEGQVARKGWGGGRRKTWNTVPVIVDALNEGFHLAFHNIEPAGKRMFLALDTSGSMWWPASMCSGLDIPAATAAACMAMVTARTEPYYQVMGFSTNMRDLGITPSMSLTEIDRQMRKAGFGGTDCAQPMIWALKHKVEIDTFVVYTDNETWYGNIHPHVALRDYRNAMGIDAKLIVVGVAATEFTIADPDDSGMLDVVGFDANAPGIISNFAAGRV